jgi:hypothetical protein
LFLQLGFAGPGGAPKLGKSIFLKGKEVTPSANISQLGSYMEGISSFF